MTMDIPRFDAWCSRAVKDIRYPGDRKRVFRELREHMEDHYDDVMARGLVHWKAVEETLEAMGDPEELAPMLADIHRPGWGYAMDGVRSAVGFILICLIACLLAGPREIEPAFQPDTDFWFETSTDSSGSIRTLLLHPDISVTDGDFTLTVTDVAQWYTQIGGYPRREKYDLCLRLELRHPDPTFPEANAAPARFWARDDLGNLYPSSAEVSHYSNVHLDLEKHEKVKPGLWEWVYRIDCYDPEASWIELCYDHGGREHILHIDLTGGDAA